MTLDDSTELPLKNTKQPDIPISGPRQLRLQRQQAAAFVAFVAFGLASWLMTNATYVELGVFLRELPEHYRIYAYSIVALESANLYPLLYMLFNAQQQMLSQSTVIWWILLQGVTGCGSSGAYESTVGTYNVIWGIELQCSHVATDPFSRDVFYPFVANFPPLFTSALATGEGLSGTLAALLGIVQDPGGAMRFSVSAFYLICVSSMGSSSQNGEKYGIDSGWKTRFRY
ncbi:hypothetical protein PHMEG_00040759 [Phytophthora megakarya]|uniref:Uncharacterized protein n=1 Tax=Phytophthora megakarya TaxID=4795 RepID=A0A225UCX7_9STRA|nr:hypothetical protein PHMEG_00040759 [Phytophthora megakarya]